MSPDWAAKPTTVPYANFGDKRTMKALHVCPKFCLTKGVHPRTWEQLGNKTC